MLHLGRRLSIAGHCPVSRGAGNTWKIRINDAWTKQFAKAWRLGKAKFRPVGRKNIVACANAIPFEHYLHPELQPFGR